MRIILLSLLIITLVSVSVLFTTGYSETLNYSISENYHDYKLQLSFSDGSVTGTISSNEKTYNLDNSKLIERNSGFLIIDKTNDLRIISKNINDDTQLVIVKIKPDIRLKFITTVDTVNKNIGQRDMFAAMETVLDESNLSFKELEYLKKSILTEEAQQQYEEDLIDLIYCSYDGSNECLTEDEILANFEQYKIITGMALVVPEKIEEEIPEPVVVSHYNTMTFLSIPHHQEVEKVLKYDVLVTDDSGHKFDLSYGEYVGNELSDVSISGTITDPNGITIQSFNGITDNYGEYLGTFLIPEQSTTIGEYVISVDTIKSFEDDTNTSSSNSGIFFVFPSDDTFNNPPISNAGPDQHLPSGSVATLDGSGSSDVEDSVLLYTWLQTSGTTAPLSSNTAENPTFTIPDESGTFIFNLSVDDVTKTSDPTDNISITSLHSDAGPDQPITGVGLVTLDGSASGDALSHSFTYAWTITSVPAGSAIPLDSSALSDPTIVNPTFTTDALGEYTIQLTVDDGIINDTDTVDIVVT